jgi:hypothetical protein
VSLLGAALLQVSLTGREQTFCTGKGNACFRVPSKKGDSPVVVSRQVAGGRVSLRGAGLLQGSITGGLVAF